MRWFEPGKSYHTKKEIKAIKKDWLQDARLIRASDPSKKMLLREAKQISLDRMELGAKTPKRFKEVVTRWDIRDTVEGWRLDKHESSMPDNSEGYTFPEEGRIIPLPFSHVLWQQMLRGNFLDYIHDCPHEIHELISTRIISSFLKECDESCKELIYLRAIRLWQPKMIAKMRKQTDSGIAGEYNTMMTNLRKTLYILLYPRYVEGLSLTTEQRKFMDTFLDGFSNRQQNSIKRKAEDYERRLRKEKIEREVVRLKRELEK